MDISAMPAYPQVVLEMRPLKAKFHYAIWSHTGLKLVADLQRAGIGGLSSSSLARASRSATSLGPVCNQLGTCLRPDSVMEFGFKQLSPVVKV